MVAIHNKTIGEFVTADGAFSDEFSSQIWWFSVFLTFECFFG
jgi:hypothetical protein